MDYEQKYREALEMAKKELQEFKNKDCDDTTRKTAINLIHNLFPEFNESEDEKVRKALIELVKYAKGNCLELLHKPFNVVSMDAMLAWLEKQGEQTHAELGQLEVTKTSDQELESKKLDVDDVIAWLVANICDFEYYVNLFRKDFEL